LVEISIGDIRDGSPWAWAWELFLQISIEPDPRPRLCWYCQRREECRGPLRRHHVHKLSFPRRKRRRNLGVGIRRFGPRGWRWSRLK